MRLKQFLVPTFNCRVLTGIHDICMYMIAYVKMGASKAKLGSSLPSNVTVGADWGGPEAIAHELAEVQLQLSYLNNPVNPSEVRANDTETHSCAPYTPIMLIPGGLPRNI